MMSWWNFIIVLLCLLHYQTTLLSINAISNVAYHCLDNNTRKQYANKTNLSRVTETLIYSCFNSHYLMCSVMKSATTEYFHLKLCLQKIVLIILLRSPCLFLCWWEE